MKTNMKKSIIISYVIAALCICAPCSADAQVLKSVHVSADNNEETIVYHYLFDYDNEGRVSSAVFKGGSYNERDIYRSSFSYGADKVQVKQYDVFFQDFLGYPDFSYLYSLTEGLLWEENRQPLNTSFAEFDPLEPNHYEYESGRIVRYADRGRELRITRDINGDIVDVESARVGSFNNTITVEYDEETFASNASLCLGLTLPAMSYPSYSVVGTSIRYSVPSAFLRRIALQLSGYYGLPENKPYKRITEVSEFMTGPQGDVSAKQQTTQEFNYTVDDDGLITALDAIMTRDTYYDQPVEPYGSEVHDQRLTRFTFEWDSSISGVQQPKGVDEHHSGGAVYYSPDGKRLPAPQRGLNIVRTPDGTTKKVFVK